MIYAENNPEYDSRAWMVIDYFNELFKLDKDDTTSQDDYSYNNRQYQ